MSPWKFRVFLGFQFFPLSHQNYSKFPNIDEYVCTSSTSSVFWMTPPPMFHRFSVLWLSVLFSPYSQFLLSKIIRSSWIVWSFEIQKISYILFLSFVIFGVYISPFPCQLLTYVHCLLSFFLSSILSFLFHFFFIFLSFFYFYRCFHLSNGSSYFRIPSVIPNKSLLLLINNTSNSNVSSSCHQSANL